MMQLMDTASQTPASISFGRFQVLPDRRELRADGQPIKLTGRAFDVLMALIETRGAVIDKDALMRRVWPDRIVEENNLQVQISTLRAAFAPERHMIRTVAGRGYQFTGEVQILLPTREQRPPAGVTLAAPILAQPPTNLTEPLSQLIGRDDELGEIISLAAAHRLVTLTGAGGIGKTRLAIAVAHQLMPQFVDGVWFVDLAPLADPSLVAGAVAATVGLELADIAVSVERVAHALSDRNLLLVLDNCEHLVDAVAMMAEALLRTNAAAHVIATSREPLRAEGEWLYPVPQLAVPAAHDVGEDALDCGAVRLFVERARAAEPHLVLNRRIATAIAAICRRLDGIPLAIELVAAHAAMLGIEELAANVEYQFHLLTGGRRTALARQQTLRATFDWSYELLTNLERIILRRVSIFAGFLSLEAAVAVVSSSEVPPSDVVDGIVTLVAKSLVSRDAGGNAARYRLLDTTRAYALEKLGDSGEHDQLAQRHAEYYHDVLDRDENEPQVRHDPQWKTEYGRHLDNLRAALDWAFSSGGDALIGVALTTAAVPLWMRLSLFEECRRRVEQALAVLEAQASRDKRCEMKLHVALGKSLFDTRGAVPELGTAWTRALEIADDLKDPEYQLRSMWGLWSFHTPGGPHRVALQLAQRFCRLAAARPDVGDRLVGWNMLGLSQHYLGDQASARRHLERVLAGCLNPDDRSYIVRFHSDLQSASQAFLARILWLLGFPDQAIHAAESSISHARESGHAMSVCQALGQAACPIALWVGDLTSADRYVDMMLDHSARHSLARWHAFGRSFQGLLIMRRGDLDTGLRLLRDSLEELGDAASGLLWLIKLLMADALSRNGRVSMGLASFEDAIEPCQRTGERWRRAELLRIKGELLLSESAEGAALKAEDHFRKALDLARQQGALSWELRAATSLARLMHGQDRGADAKVVLQPVYDRFTEGFDTADLKAAKALIDAFR